MTTKPHKQFLGLLTTIAAGSAAWLITKTILSLLLPPVFRTMGLSGPLMAANAEGIASIAGLIALVIVMDWVRRRTLTPVGKAKRRHKR